MSSPNSEQAQQIVARVSVLLDEYDHCRYALMVEDSDGIWHYMTRLSRKAKVVLARGLLDDAITPRGRSVGRS